MAKVLGPLESTQTTTGGFSLGAEIVASHEAQVPGQSRRPSPAEITAAKAELDEMMAVEGADRMRIQGLNDVLAPKDDPRRSSPAAQFYIHYEELLGVANAAYDHFPTAPSIRTVISIGGGGE